LDRWIQNKGKGWVWGVLVANSPLNTTEHTIGDQTSDNMELQAMLWALEITADMPNIHVITNNESVCILVKQLINHPH
jgi:ribonuclease HI